MSQRKPWKQWSMDSCCVMRGEGGLVARFEDKATAAQIVREHNAHDALLEACELANDAYNQGPNPKAVRFTMDNAIDHIRASIALAKPV